VERGDTGLGRDAYGTSGRRRPGDRRAYRPDDGAGPNGPDSAYDEYGQLLRRPGDMPPQPGFHQPGRPRMRPPGRFPPPPGNPADGFPPNGEPVHGGPVNGGPVNGGPVPGRQYRLPNGRRVPPRADRPYRPQAPGSAGGMRGRWDQPGPGQADWGRPPRPQAPGGPPPGADAGPRAYGNSAAGTTMPGAPGFSGGPAGSRAERREGWGRLGTAAPREVPGETAGPVIRQRENAVPGERPAAPATAAVSIAPDGLESFARDLRALRAKADLDYPDMAETSHYTMKTLASAAGGLRLPTLPVAVAYVRACGGNVAEWEERWQKLATKITADAAKKRRGDGDGPQALPEPADTPALPEPPALPAAQETPAEPGEVYVITSAKPRQPGWPGGFGGMASHQEQGGSGGDRSPRG